MATYQIWAEISQLAADRFFVTVSAVPAHERNEVRTGGVKSAEGRTIEEAEMLRDGLVLEVGKRLRARGHVILDVIDEQKRGSDDAVQSVLTRAAEIFEAVATRDSSAPQPALPTTDGRTDDRGKGSSQKLAAAKTGMSERTARKREREQAGELPSQVREPRKHRTRGDPFAVDWPWVEAQIRDDPALQTKTLFALLLAAFPGRTQEGRLRTLQRHVHA